MRLRLSRSSYAPRFRLWWMLRSDPFSCRRSRTRIRAANAAANPVALSSSLAVSALGPLQHFEDRRRLAALPGIALRASRSFRLRGGLLPHLCFGGRDVGATCAGAASIAFALSRRGRGRRFRLFCGRFHRFSFRGDHRVTTSITLNGLESKRNQSRRMSGDSGLSPKWRILAVHGRRIKGKTRTQKGRGDRCSVIPTEHRGRGSRLRISAETLPLAQGTGVRSRIQSRQAPGIWAIDFSPATRVDRSRYNFAQGHGGYQRRRLPRGVRAAEAVFSQAAKAIEIEDIDARVRTFWRRLPKRTRVGGGP